MGLNFSSSKVSAQDVAILKLKVQRDNIQQYQKRIADIAKKETEIARNCLRNGDKSRALLALKRKKYQESMLTKTDTLLANLEMLVGDVEFSLIQKDVLLGLQQGTTLLKSIQREIGSLEKVERLIDDSHEARKYQQELSDLLGREMTFKEETEANEEFAALENEILRAKLPATLANPISTSLNDLPEVPHVEDTKISNTDTVLVTEEMNVA